LEGWKFGRACSDAVADWQTPGTRFGPSRFRGNVHPIRRTPMLRRNFLLAGAAAACSPGAVLAASRSLHIWGLWTLDPTPGCNGLNQVKGTLHFRVGGDTVDRSLKTYGNGASTYAPERQCVELIKRYAGKLGLPGFAADLGPSDDGRGLPWLGDGYQAASTFAGISGGAFVYVANGALSLPKPGAVISIEEFIPGGHVGIVCNHDPGEAESGSLRIKIFEQNMPIDRWKEIQFVRQNGAWFGTMPNKGRAPTVIGWADPVG
jgi:hypothetical protein